MSDRREPEGLPTFEPTGEVRAPKKGEHFLELDGRGVMECTQDWELDVHAPIYRRVPAAPAGAERVERWKSQGTGPHATLRVSNAKTPMHELDARLAEAEFNALCDRYEAARAEAEEWKGRFLNENANRTSVSAEILALRAEVEGLRAELEAAQNTIATLDKNWTAACELLANARENNSRYVQRFRHMHVAGTTAGLHSDVCASCRLDLRDPIHRPAAEKGEGDAE